MNSPSYRRRDWNFCAERWRTTGLYELAFIQKARPRNRVPLTDRTQGLYELAFIQKARRFFTDPLGQLVEASMNSPSYRRRDWDAASAEGRVRKPL